LRYDGLSEWHDFVSQVQEAEDLLGNPELIWYRGVVDESHRLLPSLLRRENGAAKERDLFVKYRTLAMTLQENRDSDWQTLFDMQHHGIPTRLLDWTEVLGIAVFFATLGNPETHAAVYVLDPVGLNARSLKVGIPQVDDKVFAYRSIYWHHDPVTSVWPIAIEAP